jgi:hypothetical protein
MLTSHLLSLIFLNYDVVCLKYHAWQYLKGLFLVKICKDKTVVLLCIVGLLCSHLINYHNRYSKCTLGQSTRYYQIYTAKGTFHKHETRIINVQNRLINSVILCNR